MNNLNNLTTMDNLNKNNIANMATSDIFETFLWDFDYFLRYIQETCSNLYYISTYSNKIDDYKDNPAVFNILKQYQDKSDYEDLELLIFQHNPESINRTKEKIQELKSVHGDIISGNVIEYSFIVGYDKGSSWRSAKWLIDNLKKHTNIIDISIN